MALRDLFPRLRRDAVPTGPVIEYVPVIPAPGSVQLSPFVESPSGLVITREGTPVTDLRIAAAAEYGELAEARGPAGRRRSRQPALPEPGGARQPERLGYLYGIPEGGLDDTQASLGASTGTDRKSLLQELYEAYLMCPWAWASVNAVARTITAGGLVTDWDSDTGEGNDEQPDKPPEVLALERLIDFCNPSQDIRQLIRNVIADLEVFGGAYIEVTWWGSTPVALWNLDYPTTTPLADAHGMITGYVQVSDFGQRAKFEPRQVIYISLDSARSGVFGISPTQAAMAPITAWLFAHATSKEMFRKGLPAEVHADMPAGMGDGDLKRWRQQYMAGNLGAKNIGNPIITKNGAKLTLLQPGKVADCMAFMDLQRDEIVSAYGVPPAKVGIIESGNLGGGTGESQDRTFRVNTCQPIAELVLEKLNFALVRLGFGIDGWHLKFGDVDMRDSQVIEAIRDMRLRNGSWTLNKYRAAIGELPVDGGDDAVLVDRQNLVLWRDMARMSDASIAAKGAPAAAQGESVPEGTGEDDEDQDQQGKQGDDDDVKGQPPGPGKPGQPPQPAPGAAGQQPGNGKTRQRGRRGREAASWQRRYDAYRQQLTETLDAMGWEPPGHDKDTAA